MFYDYRATELQNLSDSFLEQLFKNRSYNPFSPNWIIVQNREMQQWLTLQEAQKNHISANNDFIFPQEFLWKLFRLKNPTLSKSLSSDRVSLQWSIHQCFLNDSSLLRRIIGSSSLEEKQLIQLSKTIADVFDLYQVYRPNLITEWEKGNLCYTIENEEWQALLWTQLKALWNEGNEPHFGRVDAFNSLLKWLKNNDFPIEKIPEHIWIFSLPQWSQPFSEIIAVLSNLVDVHSFNIPILGNSTKNDTEAFSQKLLAASVNNYSVLQDSLKKFNSDSRQVTIPSKTNEGLTKLSALKKLIRNEFVDGKLTKDSTLGIHSCHSIKREVEVLKEELLFAFNEDSNLKPEECLILVPKLSQYHLEIEKTLANEVDGINIPVSKNYRNTHEYRNNTLLQLLTILNSDFKVNDVLSLLENDIIAKNFDINNEEFVQLQDWCVQLHVHRTYNDSSFSWIKAIDRMFLGFAMQSNSFKTFQNKSPFVGINSSDSALLASKLSNAIHTLHQLNKGLSGTNTLHKWLIKLERIIHVCLFKNYNDDYQIQELINTHAKLLEHILLSRHSEDISFDAFFLWFKDRLDSKESTSTGYGHGVQISDYVPNRSIPAKFVAILGLNENVLPYPIIRPDYDLIHKFPTNGDRIEKFEQRYLFHDLIQSATNKLHISYIGQSEYSDNKKLPSILLQQLIDVANSVGYDIKVEQHSLHGFNANYFKEESPQSYSTRKKSMAEQIRLNVKNKESLLTNCSPFKEEASVETISINDLKLFFTHPAKYLCNNLLGISNYTDYAEPDNRDYFKISGLDNYFLKSFLTTSYLQDQDLSSIDDLLRAANLIPEGYSGELEAEHRINLIYGLEKIKKQHDFSTKNSLELEFNFNEKDFVGVVSDVYEGTRVKVMASSQKPKYLTELWLNHLLLNLNGTFNSELHTIDKKLEHVYLKAEGFDVKSGFSQLLEMYISALKDPQSSFYPIATSHAFAKEWNNNADLDNAIQKALKKWDSKSDYAFGDDSTDYYNQLVFKDESFIYTESFQNWANKLWIPIFKSMGK